MPPKNETSNSSVTLQITLKTISCTPTSSNPSIIFQFPQQQPVQVDLTQNSRTPSAKKSSRAKEPTQLSTEPVVIQQKITKEFDILNPDNSIQPFIADQLKIYFDDPATKGKLPAQFLQFDCTCFLVALELSELIQLTFNDITYNAHLTIRVIASKHDPPTRITSFLSPKSLPTLHFKILNASHIFQYQDPEWRFRYLQPVKIECKILGNTYFSDPIDQRTLGSERKSITFPVRLITAYACKSEAEMAILKRQVEENQVEITVHCRALKGGLETEKPKSAQGKGVAQPIISDSFISFTAECKLSLKSLLDERVFEEQIKLVPKYKLDGRVQVPDLSKMHGRMLDRQPVFQTQQVLGQVGKEGKGAGKDTGNGNVEAKTTSFSSFQKAPDTLPLGDWSEAFISVRAAFQRPLSSWAIESGQKVDSRQSSAKSSKKPQIAEKQDDLNQNVLKPDFNHFERMYIYLGGKQYEMVKQVLQYVANVNLEFIQKSAQQSFKEQFSLDAADHLSDYIGQLSTTNLQDAIVKADANSFSYNFISGYRFIDKNIQLFMLEAPAKFDTFLQLRFILDQMACIYKAAPAVQFRKRSLPDSPFLLQHFSLVKPIVKLSLEFNQQISLVQKFVQLFNVTSNKLFPLESLKMDLRSYQQADLFFNQEFLNELMKNFAGNIPKQADINFLFTNSGEEKFDDLTSVQRSMVSMSNETCSSPTRSECASPIQGQKVVKEKQIKMITLKHRQLQDGPLLLPIPDEILTVSPIESPKSSQKYLPSYQINIKSGIINNSESDVQRVDSGQNSVLEKIQNEIFAGTTLKGESVIKQVLEGKRVFQYSSQTLNKYSMQARILDKTLNGKNIATEIDVQQPVMNKQDPLYKKERNWK